MGEPIEQRSGHVGAAEHRGPFAEGEIGGDDDRGALVEPADQMEEVLAAGVGGLRIAAIELGQRVETIATPPR